MYDKIEDTENLLVAARAKKMAIEAEKLTGDNIYKVLIYFDKLYSVPPPCSSGSLANKTSPRPLPLYNSSKMFFSNRRSPSSRILQSSFDMALRSTERKSASCWRLKGMAKRALPHRLASSDR